MNFLTSNTIIIVITVLIVLTNLIVTIINVYKLTNSITHMENIIYLMNKKCSLLLDSYYSLKHNVEHLSTSFSNVQQSFDTAFDKKLQMKRMPSSSDEIKEIEKIIEDQIVIEISLSKDQKIRDAGMFDTIITNVCKTFPDIEIEYITKKVTSKIESIK